MKMLIRSLLYIALTGTLIKAKARPISTPRFGSKDLCGSISECDCTHSTKLNGTHVDCSEKNLTQYFSLLLTDVDSQTALNMIHNSTDLDLNRGNLSVICSLLPNIKSISLANNNLTDFALISSRRTDCLRLRELNLTGNKLHSIKASSFQGATNLETLTLETEDIEPNALDKLGQLEKLDLLYHGCLATDFLDRLTQLFKLTLKLTGCKALLNGHLNSTSLTELTLTGLELERVSPSFNFNLDNLKRLHLDLPKLKQLSLDFGASLPQLEILKLRNVGAVSSLSGLHTLKELYIENHLPLSRLETLTGLKVKEINRKGQAEEYGTLKGTRQIHQVTCGINGTIRHHNLACFCPGCLAENECDIKRICGYLGPKSELFFNDLVQALRGLKTREEPEDLVVSVQTHQRASSFFKTELNSAGLFTRLNCSSRMSRRISYSSINCWRQHCLPQLRLSAGIWLSRFPH
ncbi:leucine-rich repeat-containing protein 4-like [Plakobranchus ocellatus]|uniref:Leucine-rich repeat-containing protein 4-like n=1 Tax=Plakobranchus ocellatus TaxID=259542 RepID=A0AAV4B9F8_9GAST|nr:leucine-rich repeat-containing protein 4-like [Plakobranchus ocellatus]